jgi:hypothetical protein
MMDYYSSFPEPSEETRLSDLKKSVLELPGINEILKEDLDHLLRQIVKRNEGFSQSGYIAFGMRRSMEDFLREFENYKKRKQAALTIKKYTIPYITNPARPSVLARLLGECETFNLEV